MEKKRFERYPYLIRRISKLETPVSDTVRASSAEEPCLLRTVTIHGVVESPELAGLRREKEELDKWIASRPEEDQEILRAVAKHGTHWDVVRREVGLVKSGDAVRKMYERIFREKK